VEDHPSVLGPEGARLLNRPCDTCVTFPDDRMGLGEEVRRAFLAEARVGKSYVICHETIGSDEAVCRGFWNLHRSASDFLSVMERCGLVVEVDPPSSPAVRST